MMEPSEVSVTVSKAGVVTKVDPSNVVVIEMGREPEGVLWMTSYRGTRYLLVTGMKRRTQSLKEGLMHLMGWFPDPVSGMESQPAVFECLR
jgi:hypothetical protein